MLPLSLQTLTFGQDFHQSCLLTLTFGQGFDQGLQGITLPISLQTLRSQGLVLQCNVQTLTFSTFFNKSSQGVNLPSSLQTLTSGAVYQSLQRVELQHVLQHELAGCQSTKQPAYIDLWRHLPESATCRAAVQHVDQPADIDLQHFLQPELNQGLQMSFCQAARRHSPPPELTRCHAGELFADTDLRLQVRPGLGGCHAAGQPTNLDLWPMLQPLPFGLQTLTFGQDFHWSLQGVTLPSSIQTLTLGRDFTLRSRGVVSPRNPRTWAFSKFFNQSCRVSLCQAVALLSGLQYHVTLPFSLQPFTFGQVLRQSLQGVTLPSSLQTLTFGYTFDHSSGGVTLPRSPRTWTFGHSSKQSLQGVALLSSLQRSTLGQDFLQGLKGVAATSSMQTLTFGYKFNQNVHAVTMCRC